MTQTSYEIVRRAIEFDNPERLPLRFVGYPVSDAVNVDWNYIGPGDINQPQVTDEWGCLWVRTDAKNMGQIKGHPLDEWDKLSSYRFPDPDNPAFFAGMAEKFDWLQDKYILTDIFMLLFERLQALRGFENLMMDFYQERSRLEQLIERIVEFDIAIIDNLSSRFGSSIHGFWFTEDLGTQNALMMRPSLWRELFKPRYIKIIERAKDAGWHVWIHSDGMINDILEDLLEIGVDVLNLMSPLVNGIETTGKTYTGRVCFESSVDLQHTLPFAGRDEIRQQAAELVKWWAAPQGGFILSVDRGDQVALQIPEENLNTMIEAFQEFDPWKK